jgi:predicted protein tyrosine phosphatase
MPNRPGEPLATLLAVLLVLLVFMIFWAFRWRIIESMVSFHEAREIEAGLWIGSTMDARDEDFIKRNDIRLIVNATDKVPRFVEDPGVEFVRIPVRDIRADDRAMLEGLPRAVEALQRHRRQNHAVLVHCFAGVSRSATVCAAYLMADRNVNADQAIAAIRAKKPETFGSRPVFRAALEDFQKNYVGV